MKSTTEKDPRRTRKSSAPLTAREHYRREKARRSSETAPLRELLLAAQKEYDELLRAEAAKRKGGRPKGSKSGRPTGAADSEVVEESAEE
jgi:hypothetical protein